MILERGASSYDFLKDLPPDAYNVLAHHSGA
jgi:hypothetical protein